MTVSAGFEGLGLFVDFARARPKIFDVIAEGRSVGIVAPAGKPRDLWLQHSVLQWVEADAPRPQVLLLTPSFARAAELVASFCSHPGASPVDALAVQGRSEIVAETKSLKGRPPWILAGTGHALVDHLYRGSFLADAVRGIVLEAPEEMLSEGLWEDVETLASCLLSVQRLLLFAAQVPQEVQAIIQNVVKEPILIAEIEREAVRSQVPLNAQHLASARKAVFLSQYLREEKPPHACVICGTRGITDKVDDRLQEEGLRSIGRIDVLLDSAVEDSDLTGVTHLIHFSVPRSAEAYQDRIARCGLPLADSLMLISPPERPRFDELFGEFLMRGEESPLEPEGSAAPASVALAGLTPPSLAEEVQALPVEQLAALAPEPIEPMDALEPAESREESLEDASEDFSEDEAADSEPAGRGSFELDQSGQRRRRRRRRRNRGPSEFRPSESRPPESRPPESRPSEPRPFAAAASAPPSRPAPPPPPSAPHGRERRPWRERTEEAAPPPRRRREFFRDEDDYNRKGVAPEPPAINPNWNSGMLVGENRDRWSMVDRRGRPVKRPWLSEDDKRQRLYGNQLAPDERRKLEGAARNHSNPRGSDGRGGEGRGGIRPRGESRPQDGPQDYSSRPRRRPRPDGPRNPDR